MSIIIPAFDGDEFISDTIQSVRNQYFRDWGLLVIDDNSSGHTYKKGTPTQVHQSAGKTNFLFW